MSNRPRRRLVALAREGAAIGLQMRFEADDEAGFQRVAATLIDEFTRWLDAHGVPGDPSDAEVLLDWRFNYDDAVLDVWRVADVAEFLLSWCPRKLSAAPVHCPVIVASVAAFVRFLAHSGRLDPASDRPATIQAWCDRNSDRFQAEMANPDNYGMAKGLFAEVGGLDLGRQSSEAEIAAAFERMNSADPAVFDAVKERVDRQRAGRPTSITPVRLPDPAQRRDAIADAPLLRQARALAEQCSSGGLVLTGTGNLRLADARALVETLETGDETTGLRSAAELPGLDWVFNLALAAGAVRRHKGKLLAVARFAALDDLAAHETLVAAALSQRPSGSGIGHEVAVLLADCRPAMLVALLAAGPDGLDEYETVELFGEFVIDRLPAFRRFADRLGPSWLESVLDELDDLGLIEITDDVEPCDDCDEAHWNVSLSPAGVHPAVEVARRAGIEVPLRPDPAGLTAAELAELAVGGHPEDWLDDVRTWFALQPEPGAAARALLPAVAEAPGVVWLMGAIAAIEEIAPEPAIEAVRTLLGGPRDGLALMLLLDRNAVDPAEATADRLLGGALDMLAFALDAVGEQALVQTFGGSPVDSRFLDEIWRLDHPRLLEILDVLGARLPDKATAKRARRSAIKLRSRLGAQRTQL